MKSSSGCRLGLWILSGSLALAGCGGGAGGTPGDTTAPSIPVISSIAPASRSEIDLAWFASTDNVAVTGYRVYRAGVQVATPSGLSFHDSGLSAGTEYCYTVAAYDAAGNASAQGSPACATTLPPTPPAPPAAAVGLDALGADGQITLRWEPVAGATSYNLYFAAVTGVTSQNWASLQGGGRVLGVSNPYVRTGLTNLVTSFYVVTAANAGGEGPASLQVAAQPVKASAGLVGGWDWLQPRLTGDWLTAVHFASASEGWTVGSAGTILHTGDGGATWARQEASTTSGLTDVDFVGASTGWAVGGGGSFGQTYATILHTTDGGVTWRSQAAGDAPFLSGVDFVDASNGWAVGSDGVILHTADGGRTWARQASGTTALLWKVRFLDASTGWVAGGNGGEGVVLRTTDGGSTWAATTLVQAQLTDLFFASAMRGWAVDAATPGRILGTTDGGVTWGPLPTGSTASLQGIAFADASTGWAVGSAGVVLKTTNGGASWTTTSAGPSATLSGVAVRGPQDLVVVGDSGSILRSGDGGATWAPEGGRTLPRFTPATLTFPDAATGWAAVDATAYRTGDGGFTWAAQPIFSAEPLGWLQFVSGTAGWAVGRSDGTCLAPPCNAVYRTLDGGTTWELRGHVASAGMQVWNVDFADDLHGWAVGVGGLIRATADGGGSWTTQSSGTVALLSAVKAVDGSTAWVVGDGGMILKTVNGGAQWLGQLSGTTQWLNAITAADATRAWAVGGNSSPGVAALVATTDGGAHWVAQSHPGSGTLSDVHFVNATTGWAVGSGGMVLGTTDGGASWGLQACATTQDLYRIRAASGQVGWIATSGDLLGTASGGR
jgi:photosystem II stability/assembly factor-like uncharacterized protein